MQNIYEANNNNNNNNNCFNPGLKLARNSDGFSAPSVSRDLKPGNKHYKVDLFTVSFVHGFAIQKINFMNDFEPIFVNS